MHQLQKKADILHSLCFGLFLSLLDTSIVATALYTIGAEFNALNSVTWVALAYTLSYVGCTVLFAQISDVVGRRNAFAAAFVIFVGFSIGCGFSQSLNQLIACRALQGVGGSGLYSLTMIIFPEISPPKMRQWIASIAGMVIAMSGVLGPILGGIITHYTTWRWVFWIKLACASLFMLSCQLTVFSAPIGILPIVLFCVAWPRPNQLQHAERRHFREMDSVGCFLLVAASVLVVFSFQVGGLRGSAWGTALFLAPLLVGCLCWVLFFGWEFAVLRFWHQTVAPIFPPRLLQRRVYTAAVLATLPTGFVYFVVIYSLPIHFQIVNGKSALGAGIGLLPMLGSAAIGSMLGGMLSAKKNRIYQVLVVAACLMVIGAGLLSTLTAKLGTEPSGYGFQVLVGLGFGLTVSSVSMLAATESEIRDHAVAQGIMAQARVFGGSIGIAASTAILAVVERRELAGLVSPSQLTSLASAAASLSPAALFAIRKAYADAFDKTLRVTAIVACAGFLLTLGTIQRNPLSLAERRKEQMEAEMRRQQTSRKGSVLMKVRISASAL